MKAIADVGKGFLVFIAILLVIYGIPYFGIVNPLGLQQYSDPLGLADILHWDKSKMTGGQ